MGTLQHNSEKDRAKVSPANVFVCAGKRYRMTPQRQAVLDVVRRASSPLDAVWVCEEVRKVIPNVSLATVYRTLSLLREAGFISEAGAGVSGSRDPSAQAGAVRLVHDGSTNGREDGSHCQVTCVRCRRIVDIPNDVCADFIIRVASATAFEITGHHLVLNGLCPGCAPESDRN